MKNFIASSTVGAGGVTDRDFVKVDGNGGVITNTDPTAAQGVANASKAVGDQVGVIVDGVVEVKATVNATYNQFDAVELDIDGQTIKAGSTNQVGVAWETKTTDTTNNTLYVKLNLA